MDSRAQALVRSLTERGIGSEAVLAAMLRVPREQFIGADQAARAYEDSALPIEAGQTISQPYVVALMTEAADLRPGLRVLEVGTGSGYQSAILAELGVEVFSIERHEGLAESAKARLGRYPAVRVFVGDGSLGLPAHAPFDRILVTAGAPRVPEALVEQLAVGGRLVIPVGADGAEELLLIRKTSGTTCSRESLGAVRFVPLIGAAGWS